MKATKIYYKELRTTGSYNNQELAIELELEEGEKAKDALQKAKLFVKAGLASDGISPALVEGIAKRLRDAQSAMDDLVARAQEATLEDEIPF
jgi:hypothetical protein